MSWGQALLRARGVEMLGIVGDPCRALENVVALMAGCGRIGLAWLDRLPAPNVIALLDEGIP